MKSKEEIIVLLIISIIITEFSFWIDSDSKTKDIKIIVKETILMNMIVFAIVFLSYFGLKYLYKKIMPNRVPSKY